MKYEFLSDNIRLLCYQRNIKLSELSKYIVMTERRIYDIVANKPIKIRQEEIEMLANYFQVEPDTLKFKKAYLEINFK